MKKLLAGNINYTSPEDKKIAALEERVRALEAEVAECKRKANVRYGSLPLSGDIGGTLMNNYIKPNAITSYHIKDHSIEAEDVNSSQIQLRIKSSCSEGEFLVGVDEEGNAICLSAVPSLSEVLREDGDAKGYSISNVGSVEARSMRASESLCLSGECIAHFSDIFSSDSNYRIVSESCIDDDSSYGETCVIGRYSNAFCALTRMGTNGDSTTSKCFVFTAGYNTKTNEWIWEIYSYRADCEASCIIFNP